MDPIFAIVKKLRASDDGVTAIEYGLIAALIAVAIIASAQALGVNIAGAFARVSAAITAA